ncbi:MAG: two-component system sensor histidine kinase BarA [Halieaceae bacterium]|jgi:two-component system sensor histidine kinase BarA
MASFKIRSGMRSKILALVIVPVLSISIGLSWYFMAARQADLTNSLQRLGTAMALGFAAASDLPVFAGDVEALRKVARSALQDASVMGVSFVAIDGPILFSEGELGPSGNAQMPEDSLWQLGQYRGARFWYFRGTIKLHAETMDDYPGAEQDNDSALGWVVIAMSLDEYHQARSENFIIGSTVAIIATLLVSIAAWLFAQRIYRPVRELTKVVKIMESGDLTVQANLAGEEEVQVLARVVNQLASTLRETNESLEKDITRATEELTYALAELENRNRDLVTVGDELESAMAAKDQLLARMSHELRTPLTAVIGFTRRLDSRSLSSEQIEYRDAIYHSSLLLASIIDDILDFSRMEYSDIALDEREFDLENALDEIVVIHAYSAYEKAIELIVFMDSDVPRTYLGDPVRFKQIINNLLANSIKFTDAGEVVVQVGLLDKDSQATDDQKVVLEISIRDSGIGIAAEDIEKLFKPFSQADASIHRRFGGSGLGLVISQQLVERMGGSISVHSEQGKGTTFQFSLQLIQAGADHVERVDADRLDEIAIVDGNRWSRRALRSQVAHHARQVFAFAITAELVELLREGRINPGSILISLGADVIQAQLLAAQLADIRKYFSGDIIVLTCGAAGQAAIPERLLGAYQPLQCLSKPVRRTRLVDSLFASSGRAVEASQIDSVNSRDNASHGQLAGVAVLVAEDNRYNKLLLKTLLETQGARVMIASNGIEAVEIFEASDCRLVLMDSHMPKMDGAEASRQIMAGAAQTGRPVAIIGITADTTEKERSRLQQAGVKEVLFKPIDEEILLMTLCRYAERSYTDASNNAGIISFDSAGSELTGALLEQTDNLRKAMAAGDLSGARETVHQLLGFSGLYAMVELRRMVVELDQNLLLPQTPEQTTRVTESLATLEALIHSRAEKGY